MLCNSDDVKYLDCFFLAPFAWRVTHCVDGGVDMSIESFVTPDGSFHWNLSNLSEKIEMNREW